MKSQINIRASELLQRQLNELTDKLGTSITETVSLAIDRMYQQEIKNMKTYTITNERYSNEPVEATIADLQQLAAENEWDIEFTETIRDDKNVIIDNRNEVVAE